MRTRLRQLGTFLFISIVIFLPLFEMLDHSEDLQQGTDIVQAVLFALTFGTLAVLLTNIAVILFRSLKISTIVPRRTLAVRQHFTRVEPSPPKLFVALCTIRI
jgi:hypothetical protein